MVVPTLVSITLTTESGDFGILTDDKGIETFSSIPPGPGNFRAAYDNALTANIKPITKLPEMPMPDITDRQFAAGLWIYEGILSYPEYIDFVSIGKIPDSIEAVLQQIPNIPLDGSSTEEPADDNPVLTERRIARGFLAGAKTFSFKNPFVEMFRLAQEKIDPKWTKEYQKQQWLIWAQSQY